MTDPALTPEEWRQQVRQLGLPEECRALSAALMVVLSDPDAVLDRTPGEMRHAVAALVLEGQGFGFTWEDVDALRDATAPESDWLMDPAKLNSLADRIAALLPPR